MKRTARRSRAPVKAGARIEERKLDNGMTVLLVERHLDPVVAVMLWYRVGARNETEREAGVSHFLEHMMFKGSARFGKGEVDRLTTTLGGSNNAFTTADHTAYWFEFASDRWERALEIEADRMRGLLLDPSEFAAEKAVVLEELAMGEDDPWRNLSQQVQMALFPRHPYRRPVIGFADTLRALEVERMRDYYRRFYHPGNAILVVCGDIDPETAFAAVRRSFGDLPAGPPYAEADPWRPSAADPRGEVRLETRWDDEGRRLCIAWPTVAVGSDDDYALDLVSTLLSGGRMSRLHRRLVLEQGLATSISTHNDTRIEGGSFWVFGECAQGVEPGKLEREIDAEIERLANETVPAAELARAKRLLEASEAYDSETVSDLAEELGEYAADARWQLALETLDRVRATTAPAVRDCVVRLLTRERRVVGWSLPKKGAVAAKPRARKQKPASRAKPPTRVRRGAKAARRGGRP